MEIFQVPALQSEVNRLNIQVLDMAYAKLDKRWRNGGFYTTFTRIYMVRSGSAMIRCEGQEVLLLPGNIYIIPAGVMFEFCCDGEMEKFFYHINVPRYNQYDIFDGCKKCIILHNRAKEIEKTVAYCQENTVSAAIALKEQLYRLVLQAIRAGGIEPGDIENYSNPIKIAVSYIHSQLNANLTIEAIAQRVGLTPLALQKHFRQEIGIPLRRYINDQLMIAAEQALWRKNLSVSQISEQLGFCDQFYFSRRFKQHFGISPTAYRKRIFT